MAKGFTVKAKTPPKGTEANKATEWDYDKAKEMLRGKSIVFCLPWAWCQLHIPQEFCPTLF